MKLYFKSSDCMKLIAQPKSYQDAIDIIQEYLSKKGYSSYNIRRRIDTVTGRTVIDFGSHTDSFELDFERGKRAHTLKVKEY